MTLLSRLRHPRTRVIPASDRVVDRLRRELSMGVLSWARARCGILGPAGTISALWWVRAFEHLATSGSGMVPARCHALVPPEPSTAVC